jgi:pilus assembly protein CpaC
MRLMHKIETASVKTAIAAVLVASLGVMTPAIVDAAAMKHVAKLIKAKAMKARAMKPMAPTHMMVGNPAGSVRPSSEITLSVGRGQLINLSAPMSDVVSTNPSVASVQVRSQTQLFVTGKSPGESSVYATSKGGQVLYSANVRVGSNLNSLSGMLRLAMPESDITATTMNDLVLLTGTVAGPDDAAQAELLVRAYVNPGIGEGEAGKFRVVSRLKTATPLQVMLQVKIAEVNRSLVKEIGANLLTRDTTGGFKFNVAQGRNFASIGPANLTNLPRLDASTRFGFPAGTIPPLPYDVTTGNFVLPGSGTNVDFGNLALGAGKTAIGLYGKLFGLDVASALDLAETDGLVTTLAQPNLTALSGEAASFLAGGEIPIPLVQGNSNSVTVEYKQYGVSLSFIPIVLGDGRISIKVRPEVSELTSNGAVQLNGFTIPALTTRRVETTVELGSGQSFMIGGLLSNSNNNLTQKAPGAGDVPILGALFRSNSFRRNETELMVIVTPYLVKPVSANEIALPTDGYKSATDVERVFLGQDFSGKSGEKRPVPTMAPPATKAAPSVGEASPDPKLPPRVQAQALPPVAPVPSKPGKAAKGTASVAPGFSFN